MTRPAMCLLGLMLLGCGGSVTRTVALQDADAYGKRSTVVSVEGYTLDWEDGGQLAPAARDGRCLVYAGKEQAVVGEREVTLHVLQAKPGPACSAKRIRKPLSVTVEDDTLTIVGRDGGVRVSREDVFGVRVYGAKDEGEKVAEASARSFDRVGTEPRSTALVAVGSGFIVAGLAGAVAIGVADSRSDAVDSGASPSIGWVALSAGAGLGAGIPMIIVGAKQVPASREAVSLELGLGEAQATIPF